MPDLQEEKKYDTLTAKIFYRIRDLFVEKGSVFTAKSINLASVGITAVLVISFMGLALYRISKPIGQRSQGWEKNLMPTASESLKVTREPKAEERAVLPSNEELLQRLAGMAIPPEQREDGGRNSSSANYEFPASRPPDFVDGLANPKAQPGVQTTERKRENEPVDSTMAFEIKREVEKEQKERKDYEYVNLMAPAQSPLPRDEAPTNDTLPSTWRAGQSTRQEATEKRSLFQEVRARLLTRIDTSIPGSTVVAEIARGYDLNGFKLKRGDLLLGTVSMASPRRIALHFDRLIDSDKREYEIQAEALDLAGATGLAARPADSRLKKGLLFANDRALDYVRAFQGRVSIYNNPIQGDLRQLENKAMIVEPNIEFYVVFSKIQTLERSS